MMKCWSQCIRMFEKLKKFLSSEYEQQIQQPEPVVQTPKPDIFASIHGLDAQKRLTKRHLHASSPTSFLYTGHPGLAKTAFATCIKNAYPKKTIWMFGKRLTEAGIHAAIREKLRELPKEIYVVVDEIEKADPGVTDTFLEIIEEGTLTKTMATESYALEGLRVTLIATCNDFKKLKRTQPALVDRITIIGIQKPTEEEFNAICQMRLPKEGVNTETALYIANEIYKVYGPDMREAVRTSKIAKTPQDVDEVIADLKAVGVQ